MKPSGLRHVSRLELPVQRDTFFGSGSHGQAHQWRRRWRHIRRDLRATFWFCGKPRILVFSTGAAAGEKKPLGEIGALSHGNSSSSIPLKSREGGK